MVVPAGLILVSKLEHTAPRSVRDVLLCLIDQRIAQRPRKLDQWANYESNQAYVLQFQSL